jgi:hypothetical protein
MGKTIATSANSPTRSPQPQRGFVDRRSRASEARRWAQVVMHVNTSQSTAVKT